MRSDPRWNHLPQQEPREQKPAAVKAYNKNNNWAIVALSRGTPLQTAQHVSGGGGNSGAVWSQLGSQRDQRGCACTSYVDVI